MVRLLGARPVFKVRDASPAVGRSGLWILNLPMLSRRGTCLMVS